MASRLMPRLKLGGERVAKPVRGHRAGDAGRAGDPANDAGDDVADQGSPVVAGDEHGVVGMVGAPVVEEIDQHRVQRQVAVVAELADGHSQPVGGANAHDGVGFERAQLAHSQPGARQHFDNEAVERLGHGR